MRVLLACLSNLSDFHRLDMQYGRTRVDVATIASHCNRRFGNDCNILDIARRMLNNAFASTAARAPELTSSTMTRVNPFSLVIGSWIER